MKAGEFLCWRKKGSWIYSESCSRVPKNYGMTGKDHDATLFPSVYSGCCYIVSMRSQEVLALTEAIL